MAVTDFAVPLVYVHPVVPFGGDHPCRPEAVLNGGAPAVAWKYTQAQQHGKHDSETRAYQPK